MGHGNRQRESDGASSEDTDLLIALRRCDAKAYDAFTRRFAAVLFDQARRLGVDVGDRETIVTEFLDDIIIRLATREAPRVLAHFVVTSFRNRVVDLRRAERRRDDREAANGDDADALHASCSSYTLRAAEPAPSIDGAKTDARELIEHVLAECSDDERRLLLWSAHRVPLREVAAWLGISHAAARQRIVRLRARLIRGTARHLAALAPAEHARVSELLRRAGVTITIDPETEDGVL